MSITVQFDCDNCEAKAAGTGSIRREFVSFSGRPYGFGQHRVPSVETVTPKGWTSYDLIGATYCPTCTAEIWPENEEEEA